MVLLLLLLSRLLSTPRVRGGAEAVQGRNGDLGPESCLDRKEPPGEGDRSSRVKNKTFSRTLGSMKKSRSVQGVTPADVSPFFIQMYLFKRVNAHQLTFLVYSLHPKCNYARVSKKANFPL